jgi:hypothetical protein
MDNFDNLVQKILLEFPYLNKDVTGDLYNKDEKGSVIKPDSFPVPEGSVKIGELNGQTIVSKSETDPQPYTVINVLNENGVSTLELVFEPTKEKDVYRGRQIESSKDNKVKATDLYYYLIKNLGYGIISDNEQTIGGQKIWLKLFEKPDIKFFQAYETKIKDPKISPISEWRPLKKSDLRDISNFWSDNPKSFQSTVILKAIKK